MNYIIQNTDKIPIFSKIFPFNWYFFYELPNYEFPIFSFNIKFRSEIVIFS